MEYVNQSTSEDVRHVDHDMVLILGGSGFIGTRLAALFSGRGTSFLIGDPRPSNSFMRSWRECDVRRFESVRAAATGASSIINLAAEHRDDVFPISRYHETNVEGAVQVCNAARHLGIQRIIFTSSAAVYGFHPYPINEDGPFEPFNEYGKTKLEAEGIYRKWAEEDTSRTLVMIRPTVVFGEGNRGNVHNLLRQIVSRQFFMVGSGKNVKSMAYVDNVAAFLAYSLSLKPGLQVFNYVDGPDMTTGDLVNHVLRCLGRSTRVPSLPVPVAMTCGHALDVVARLTGKTFPISAIRVRKFCENTQFLAERAIQSGFTPPFSLSEGLERTIRSEFSDRPRNS